jgi:ABC-type phosphate/phosphonate transport system substrate-binding protein
MIRSLLAVAAVLVSVISGARAAAAPPINVVIVYLGGPDAGAEGKKLIDELVVHLGSATGLPAGSFTGAYFNDGTKAVAHLEKNRDAFVLGSLGFFLAHRKSLALVPLARLNTGTNGSERFYIVANKEQYTTLEAVRGKTLWGSPLYEDPRFLDLFVFGGKLALGSYFKLERSNRPLSAIRKLEKKEGVDAVLLNSGQYEGVTRMTLFDKLSILFTSEPVPTLGFMMVDTPRTQAIKAKMLETVTQMCDTKQGAPVCTNFGIKGFAAIPAGTFDPLVARYEAKP